MPVETSLFVAFSFLLHDVTGQCLLRGSVPGKFGVFIATGFVSIIIPTTGWSRHSNCLEQCQPISLLPGAVKIRVDGLVHELVRLFILFSGVLLHVVINQVALLHLGVEHWLQNFFFVWFKSQM